MDFQIAQQKEIHSLCHTYNIQKMAVLDQSPNEADQEPQLQKNNKKTLDLFWKLGHVKNEKQVIDVSSKILQSISKSEQDRGVLKFALQKLMMSLAGNNMASKNAYFVCFTELLRQTSLTYQAIREEIQSNLKPVGTLTKGEEANYLMAQMLVYSAVLRAEVDLDKSDKEEIIDNLAEIASARIYFVLPVIKLYVENFIGNSNLHTLIRKKFPLKMDSLNMDLLYLFLSLYKEDQSEEFLKEVGATKIAGKKSLGCYSTCLLNATLPPFVVAQHPGFQMLLSTLIAKKAVNNFWQIFSSEMTTNNNKGILGWIILKEIAKTNACLVPDLLTRHTLVIGTQLAVKQSSMTVVKEVFTKIVEAKEIEKLDVMKKLLDVDLCWDKLPLGGTISSLLASASTESIKEVADIYVKAMLGDGKVTDRVHSATMLVKIVGLSAIQEDLEWRQVVLHHLASVSVLTGVSGVSSLNSSGRDQMKEVLFRGLDTRNKSLGDSVVLLLSVVRYIQNQRQSGTANPIKQMTTDQENMCKKALEKIDNLDKKFKKTKNNEAGVFLFLYCQMWLQMFLHPDLGLDVITELDSVCDRWAKTDKNVKSEEPAWIEVVTEVLLTLLAQNNHLLRVVVGSVFSVLGRDLSGPALDSLLNVITKKDEGESGEDDEEDEDGEEMDVEDNEDDNTGDESEDSEESEEDESDNEAENGKDRINEDFKIKVTNALGNHAAGDDSESDLEMDEIPEEELNKLDAKLVDAFKALGGRKDKQGKKRAELLKIANMHFKLRVLELIDIYLNHSPKPELIPPIVSSLIQTLDYSIKAGASKEPLIKRLKSTLSKICAVKFKQEDSTLNPEAGDAIYDTLSGLLDLGSSGSVIISNLGPIYPRLTTSLLRLCQQCPAKSEALQKLFEDSLNDWLHKSTCLLPNHVFSLAMSHHWTGCWSLASLLSQAAFSADVRQFRRVAALSILSGVLSNKTLRAEQLEQIKELASNVLPSISSEIDKVFSFFKAYFGFIIALIENIFRLLLSKK